MRRVTGAEPGFAGPIGLDAAVRLLADASVEGVEGFLCGGNETDTHYLDVWFGRDLEQPETLDLGLVEAGDELAEGGGTIEITRGIEVGHIFQLGTKYASALKALVANAEQETAPMWMGCYGIGISRVAAAAIEQNNDEAGMIWPLPIAPYSVLIVQMRVGDADQDALADELHGRLEDMGVDVLWDDREKISPGARFKDADLVGIPLRIVVGRDAKDRRVEWNERADDAKGEPIPFDEALERVRAALSATA